jgi:hypothetical protein
VKGVLGEPFLVAADVFPSVAVTADVPEPDRRVGHDLKAALRMALNELSGGSRKKGLPTYSLVGQLLPAMDSGSGWRKMG